MNVYVCVGVLDSSLLMMHARLRVRQVSSGMKCPFCCGNESGACTLYFFSNIQRQIKGISENAIKTKYGSGNAIDMTDD